MASTSDESINTSTSCIRLRHKLILDCPCFSTTFLWFDGQAEEAAELYTSIFPNSKITHTSRYLEAGAEHHGRQAGSVMTVTFSLDGHPFVALNGGPMFKFTPATSFQIDCKDQAEVDFFWEKLTEGGDPKAQQCGWLADKFGVSWQVVPAEMLEMVMHEDKKRVGAMTNAMMKMKKIDVAGLKEAFEKGSE